MKILLCNGAYIGDVILSTSILPALKKAFPSSSIGFLCGSWAEQVVKDHLLIDRTHLYDLASLNRSLKSKHKKKLQEKRTWKTALKEIRENGYDLALDLYSYYKKHSGALLYHSGIPQRIAFGGTTCPFFYTDLLRWNWYPLHMVDNHKMMLKKLGLQDIHLQPFLPYLAYKQEITTLSSLPTKYILIHIGTGEREREWPLHYWKELVKELEVYQLPLVFIGKGLRENKHISFITKELRSAISLCDQLHWKDLLYVVKHAHYVIGLESMAGHLAACFNTPGVFLYGISSTVRRWRPYNPLCEIATPSETSEEQLILTPNRIDKITPKEVLLKVETFFQKETLISAQRGVI